MPASPQLEEVEGCRPSGRRPWRRFPTPAEGGPVARRIVTLVLAWIVALLVVGVLGVLLALSRSPLERYVSPPLDAQGTRLELLIPRGWEREELLADSNHMSDTLEVGFSPRVQHGWFAAWFERLFRPHHEDNANLTVLYFPLDAGVAQGDLYGIRYASGTVMRIGYRRLARSQSVQVVYVRDDENAIHSTWPAIADSVRVILGMP